MNQAQHARVKEVFFEVMELAPTARNVRLRQLDAAEADIAAEVRSLLKRNISKTILGNPTPVTIRSRDFRTRSWQRLSSRVVGGMLPLTALILLTAFIGAFSWRLEYELHQARQRDLESVLNDLVDQRTNLLIHWVHGIETRFRDWGKIAELQRAVNSLTKLEADPTSSKLLQRQLIQSGEQDTIRRILERMYNQTTLQESSSNPKVDEFGYSIWNRRFEKISDGMYQTNAIGLGNSASPEVARLLKPVFDEGVSLCHVPPIRSDNGTVSGMDLREHYIMFLIPIFAPEEERNVVAVLVIDGSQFLKELQSLLCESSVLENNCYLLDKSGVIATNARDVDALHKLPLFQNATNSHGNKKMMCRDPGGELLHGYAPTHPMEDWIGTRSARGIAVNGRGSDASGYRDYRGSMVAGAWRWIDSMEIGLVLEVPMADAYAAQTLVQRWLRWLWGIPLLISIGIVAASLLRLKRTNNWTHRTLGAYVIQEKIGEGGLGVIYRGEHKLLGRPAAIKLLKEPFASPSMMRRFEREVQIASRLRHRNTVSIYDFGISKHGLFYCVMELIDGVSLSNFLAYVPNLAIDRVLWILRQVAGALQEAHELGLVHRDIKPQNIMICHDGQLPDAVKIVDFGLAKHMEDNVARDVSATRFVMGTPGFIAPERLDTPWVADPAIDVFAFGVVAFYMLTGKITMIGSNQKSLQPLLRASPYVSLVDDPKFQNLLTLFERCISPIPADRPSSMREINEELAQIADQYPWNQSVAEQWWMEHSVSLLEFAREKQHTV